MLRKVLASKTRLNLPIFTGKRRVTRVNCLWGIFTCGPQVKYLILPLTLHASVLQCMLLNDIEQKCNESGSTVTKKVFESDYELSIEVDHGNKWTR